MKYELLDIFSEPVELGVTTRIRKMPFKIGLFNLNCKMTFSEFAQVTAINSYCLMISLKYCYQLLLLRVIQILNCRKALF